MLKMSLHAENSIYNMVLSKAYQKRGGRLEIYTGSEVFLLEPDEIIEKLRDAGVSMSRKTLYNWEQWGLIPKAEFRNSRQTDYPEHAWGETYASWRLRQGQYRINKEALKDIRLLALRLEGQKITGQPNYPKRKEGEPWTWDDYAAGRDEPKIPEFVAGLNEPGIETELSFAFDWIRAKHSKLIPGCECDICASGNMRLLLKLYRMAGVGVVVTGEDIGKMQKEDEEKL